MAGAIRRPGLRRVQDLVRRPTPARVDGHRDVRPRSEHTWTHPPLPSGRPGNRGHAVEAGIGPARVLRPWPNTRAITRSSSPDTPSGAASGSYSSRQFNPPFRDGRLLYVFVRPNGRRGPVSWAGPQGCALVGIDARQWALVAGGRGRGPPRVCSRRGVGILEGLLTCTGRPRSGASGCAVPAHFPGTTGPRPGPVVRPFAPLPSVVIRRQAGRRVWSAADRTLSYSRRGSFCASYGCAPEK